MSLFVPEKHNELLTSSEFILDFYNIRYSSYGLENYFENHPEYPSLLSLKDVLMEYGIESAAMRKGNYGYDDFEVPFLCVIQRSDWPSPVISLVRDVDDKRITFSDPISGHYVKEPLSDFEKIDKGIVLFLDGEGKRDEIDFFSNRKKSRIKKTGSVLPFLFAFLSLLFPLYYLSELNSFSFTWFFSAFIITSFIGLFFSFHLMLYEEGTKNSLLREVCGGSKSKTVNCSAVLKSSGSSFLKIPWSTWGFSYFLTFFVSQIFFIGNYGVAQFWTWVSLLVSPYIVYSFIYQGKIIKKWCPLCVAIQAVLLFNFGISIFLLSNKTLDGNLNWYPIVLIILLGFSFLFASYYGMRKLKVAKEKNDFQRRWKQLKYDPDIFKSLLKKNEKLPILSDGLGIILGNRNSKNEIIKVCNPYCGPCSRAHPFLSEILKNNPDVKVRIIFTASGAEDDIKTGPVSHFLAIEENMGEVVLREALDEWYLSKLKDYKAFSLRFPMVGKLLEQKERIIAMDKWCQEMKIRATPTFFINGYELPDIYRVEELKNFL